MFHADFSREHSWHWNWIQCVSTHTQKKKIYFFLGQLSSEGSRGWRHRRGDRGSLEKEGARKRGRRQLGIFRRWQRLRSHPSPPPFRPRYFPALFLIYEPSGDSSFRSLINEGPDWIRDCNSGKFSGREITPLPARVCEQRDPGVGRPVLAFKCDDKEILITQRPRPLPSPIDALCIFPFRE